MQKSHTNDYESAWLEYNGTTKYLPRAQWGPKGSKPTPHNKLYNMNPGFPQDGKGVMHARHDLEGEENGVWDGDERAPSVCEVGCG